jgi:UDP-GlcNAc:undecaprenyl-phosphate GlcNAc-1-phosphate transferase
VLPSLGDYLLIGVIAAALTFVLTPVVAVIARRMGWVTEPNERSVHTTAMPVVGGLAMIVGFLGSFAAARLLDQFDPLFSRNSEPRGVVIAALIVFGVGFVDDIRDIPPPAKVTGIVVAGLVLVWFGVTMYYFRVPFYDVIILSEGDWTPLVTVLWLLGMTQAINLIDGLDGLAAGIVAIGSGAFFLYAQELQDRDLLTQPNFGPMFAIIACGICV